MLPTEPLKMDLRRLEVVFAATGALADPFDREFGISIVFLAFIVFRRARQNAAVQPYSRSCASRKKPYLEGAMGLFERKSAYVIDGSERNIADSRCDALNKHLPQQTVALHLFIQRAAWQL
jgi:hypothetical protein